MAPAPMGALTTRSAWGWREGCNPSSSPGLPALSMAGRACWVSLEVGVLKLWASIRFHNRPS